MTQWADGSSAGPNSLLDKQDKLLDHSSYTSSISPHTHPPFFKKKIKRQKYSIFRRKKTFPNPTIPHFPFQTPCTVDQKKKDSMHTHSSHRHTQLRR